MPIRALLLYLHLSHRQLDKVEHAAKVYLEDRVTGLVILAFSLRQALPLEKVILLTNARVRDRDVYVRYLAKGAEEVGPGRCVAADKGRVGWEARWRLKVEDIDFAGA